MTKKMNRFLPVTLIVGIDQKHPQLDNPLLGVWYAGVVVNDQNEVGIGFKHHPVYTDIGSFEVLNKGLIKKMLGIQKLQINKNEEYRLYQDTLIGDVLYVSLDIDFNQFCSQLLRAVPFFYTENAIEIEQKGHQELNFDSANPTIAIDTIH